MEDVKGVFSSLWKSAASNSYDRELEGKVGVDSDSIELDIDALRCMEKKLGEVRPESSAYMFRVPKVLREVREKAYEPSIVSIGPYHAGKDEYKMMEEVKVRSLSSVADPGRIKEMISVVARLEKQARGCYAEPVRLNAPEFTAMLVLDGCFIIQLVSRNYRGFVLRRSDMYQVRRDLMLLENQIPMFVLGKLFEIIQGQGQYLQLMQKIVELYVDYFSGLALNPQAQAQAQGEVKHLLHLIHLSWCPRAVVGGESSTGDRIIPCAAELKNANVKFMKKEYVAPTTVFDVEFEEGVMKMPYLEIEDMTESVLRNLIAYEQYLPWNELAYVTDYVCLLDGLINSSEDVEILCRCGIIQNFMGDSQVIVDMVNRLNDGVVNSSNEMFMHAKTLDRINAHHKKRWNRAVAVLHRDYFNSPWAIFSFAGAILLLLLTIAQTILSALQLAKT